MVLGVDMTSNIHRELNFDKFDENGYERVDSRWRIIMHLVTSYFGLEGCASFVYYLRTRINGNIYFIGSLWVRKSI